MLPRVSWLQLDHVERKGWLIRPLDLSRTQQSISVLIFHLLLTISGASIPPGMALTARMDGLKVRLEEQSTRLSNKQDRMSPLPIMVQCYVGLMVLPLYQLQARNVII